MEEGELKTRSLMDIKSSISAIIDLVVSTNLNFKRIFNIPPPPPHHLDLIVTDSEGKFQSRI